MAELTVPRIDFSSLGNLNDVYKTARNDAVRQRTLASLGQGDGQIDPRTLIGSGDLSLANLGIAIQNRQQDQARQSRLDERQLSRDSVDDNFRRQSLALQQRAAARAEENQDYSPQERAGLAQQYGIDPNSPQGRAFILTGKLPDTSASTPAGFMPNPSGGLQPIPGGPADPAYKRTVTDKQNAPSGYKWADANNPEAGLVAIPGGPGEKVPAEVAARLGLAKSFLGQLPEIKKRVLAGEATGIWDGTMGAANIGGAGEIRRQISSGAEALLRNLTGAGMNIDEAKKYVARYEPQINDSAKTVVSKLDQLERELRAVNDVVSQGRGGSVLDRPSVGGGAPNNSAPSIDSLLKKYGG